MRVSESQESHDQNLLGYIVGSVRVSESQESHDQNLLGYIVGESKNDYIYCTIKCPCFIDFESATYESKNN